MLLAGAPSVVRGQVPASVTVNGVAYDSLRGAPLDRARIVIAGSPRSTMTDTRGRFRFDSVAPGPYTFVVEHASLDSIGFSEWVARLTVRGGDETVRVTIPPFAQMWTAMCGPSKPPKDSGLIFGTVRSADQRRPVGTARVALSWTELAGDKKTGIVQHRVGGEVTSDSNGGYTVCGVPTSLPIRLVAAADSISTGILDLPPRPHRILRRDLFLGSVVHRGTIVGTVRDANGQLVRGARVLAQSMPETRSGVEGEFVIRDVPAGTRQIDVLSIGSIPTSAVVDVLANDTASVEVRLPKVTALDTMHVRAMTARQLRMRDLEERQLRGFGKFIDSLAVERHADVRSAISQLPNYACLSTVYIDGVLAARRPKDNPWVEVRFLKPEEIGLLEWYVRGAPLELSRYSGCVLFVWTKRWMP